VTALDDRTTTRAAPAAPARGRRRGLSTTLLGVWGAVVLVFLFLPIAVIVVYSFNTGRLLTSWQGFGFDAYAAGLDRPVIRGAIATSLQAAVGAALLSAVIGSLAGLALARRGGRWAGLLTLLLGLTLVTPEIMDAISLLGWFVSLDSDAGLPLFGNGLARLVIAHSVLSTAVVTFIVRARVSGTDSSLEEAAADLYATPWARFWDVTLPLAAPGVLAGALMAFTLSLDNTIVASFVQLPGGTPWPVYILSALRAALRPEIAAVSTLMLLLTLLSLVVVAVVLKRSGDSATDIARTLTGGS